MNSDITKLYLKGVVKGEQHDSKAKLSDMYQNVLLNEADPVDPYDQQDVIPTAIEPGVEQQEVQPQQYGAVIDTGVENAKKLLIEKWLSSGGYKDRDGSVANQVKGAIEGYVDWNLLHEYVHEEKKNQVTLPVGEGNENRIDDLLYDQIKLILKDPDNAGDAELIYMTLFSRTFLEGTVSVGRGELIITLFTSCQKGRVGDLEYMDSTSGVMVPSGDNPPNFDGPDVIQVEVKTGRGRAYSSRQGGFRNANIEIEKAVMGAVNMNKDAVESETSYLVVNDTGDFMVDVQPKFKGAKIVGFEPINSNPGGKLTIEQFIASLRSIDTKGLMGKNKFFINGTGVMKELLDEKESGVTDLDKIRKIRHQVASACILWGYANKHFRYVLIIKQAGKNANVNDVATIDPGTFRDCAYIDCTDLSNIYDKMEEEILVIDRGGRYAPSKTGAEGRALDGEGVYVGFAGSNTDIDAIGGQSSFLSDVKRLAQQQFTEPSAAEKRAAAAAAENG